MVMKINSCYISVPLSVIILLHTNTLFASPLVEAISLQADNFEHVQFKKIKPNNHVYENNFLKIDVDDSASLLMLPFDTVKKISKVSFEWRSEGLPLVNDAQHESSKAGDDAVVKIGLLLKADDTPFFNPFTPSWLKRVNELLTFPSDNMVYLVVNAKHAAGEEWLNPYNARVSMVSISSMKGLDDWQQASYQLDQSLAVVALWIMADGDNTDSKFTSYIKNIQLE